MPGLAPEGAVPGDAAEMHVGMVVHPGRPRVEHGEQGGCCAHVALVAAQVQDRFRRGLHQQAVGELLVCPEKPVQFLGYRDADMIVRARKQLGRARFEPLRGLMRVARGATAVAAGVVHVEPLAAAAAFVEVAAHGLRAAGRDVLKGAAVRREHPRAEGIDIGRPEPAEHVRNFDLFHDACPVNRRAGRRKRRACR